MKVDTLAIASTVSTQAAIEDTSLTGNPIIDKVAIPLITGVLIPFLRDYFSKEKREIRKQKKQERKVKKNG